MDGTGVKYNVKWSPTKLSIFTEEHSTVQTEYTVPKSRDIHLRNFYSRFDSMNAILNGRISI
jgi:hypothetical protein